MDAEINNVIYMELNSGLKIASSICGKTIIAGTIDRDSTVYKMQRLEVSCAVRPIYGSFTSNSKMPNFEL